MYSRESQCLERDKLISFDCWSTHARTRGRVVVILHSITLCTTCVCVGIPQIVLCVQNTSELRHAHMQEPLDQLCVRAWLEAGLCMGWLSWSREGIRDGWGMIRQGMGERSAGNAMITVRLNLTAGMGWRSPRASLLTLPCAVRKSCTISCVRMSRLTITIWLALLSIFNHKLAGICHTWAPSSQQRPCLLFSSSSACTTSRTHAMLYM